MKYILIKWIILTASIMVASYLLDGIRIDGFFSAFFAAAILGVLNVFLRPVLLIFTLPINILTLGLFTFIINAILLEMSSGVIAGFEVDGFWTAIIGSMIISIVSGILNIFISSQSRFHYINLNKKDDEIIDLKRTDRDFWE